MEIGKIRIKKDLDAAPALKGFVVSEAPAIGLPPKTLAFFAASYAIGNLLSSFAEPLFITDTIIVPPGECKIAKALYKEVEKSAEEFNVKLAGGHTGCYEGIQLPVVTITAFGKIIRKQNSPSEGDEIILIGDPGAETKWLNWLVGLSDAPVNWKELTPVSALKTLIEDENVKLAHDVSEGGILGALIELQDQFSMGISLTEKGQQLKESLPDPSYGTALAVVGLGYSERIIAKLADKGFQALKIANFGGARLKPHKSALLNLYGFPTSSFDRKLNRFSLFLKELSRINGLRDLVPEVGMNVAYSEEERPNPSMIIGIEGRIIKTANGVRIGKPAYGASRHVGYILSELKKNGAKYNVTTNLTLTNQIQSKIKRLRTDVIDVDVVDPYCPTLKLVKEKKIIAGAYIEPPSQGIEGGIVLSATDLEELLLILKGLAAPQ